MLAGELLHLVLHGHKLLELRPQAGAGRGLGGGLFGGCRAEGGEDRNTNLGEEQKETLQKTDCGGRDQIRKHSLQ